MSGLFTHLVWLFTITLEIIVNTTYGFFNKYLIEIYIKKI